MIGMTPHGKRWHTMRDSVSSHCGLYLRVPMRGDDGTCLNCARTTGKPTIEVAMGDEPIEVKPTKESLFYEVGGTYTSAEGHAITMARAVEGRRAYRVVVTEPSGRRAATLAHLNGLVQVKRVALVYGELPVAVPVEQDDLASPPNAYRDDKLHDEFHSETGMYAPADPNGTGDMATRRAQWDAWLLQRRAAREALASGGAG